MCGIAGAVSLRGEPLDVFRLKPMVDAMAHRGPDDAGYLVWQTGVHATRANSYGREYTDGDFRANCPWLPPIDSPVGQDSLQASHWDLFFGHRRLAVIDLSQRGHQPMSDQPRDIWLTYNGEIYNFPEIRAELQTLGYDFISDCDTEVVIHAYRAWGTDCIRRFNGMFALALYDDRRKRVWLARDRYGVKPLYYTTTPSGTFVFGSEIRAILQYLPETPGVDLAALNQYFSFQNVFGDHTLFAGIRLLAPGSHIELDLAAGRGNGRGISPVQYWDFDFTQESNASVDELEEQLFDLVAQAVKRQSISDVPVGSYLSGGIDSGSVTAITSSTWGRIATFTAGFDLSDASQHEIRFDERRLAEQMASQLQTEHYECVLHAGDMEEAMQDLVWHLEDLRVGQSYPNFCVARLASRFVKVVMTGIGGDELFGGYPWRYAAAVRGGTDSYVKSYYRYWQRLVPNRDKPRLFNSDVMQQLGQVNGGGSELLSDATWTAFRQVFPRHVSGKTYAEKINNALYFECKTFLHGLLVVEDKLSMAHALETRVPFLDNELVDFACRVPLCYKIGGRRKLKRVNENDPIAKRREYYLRNSSYGKNILRKTMERLLPAQITQAAKQGFSGPDESWFRHTSERYLRDALLGEGARIFDYFNRQYVHEVIDRHCSGMKNNRLLIWSLLSFECWLRAFQCGSNRHNHALQTRSRYQPVRL